MIKCFVTQCSVNVLYIFMIFRFSSFLSAITELTWFSHEQWFDQWSSALLWSHQLTQGDERGRQPDEVSGEGDEGEEARHSVPVLDVERIQHGHKPSIPHGLGEQQATSEKNRRWTRLSIRVLMTINNWWLYLDTTTIHFVQFYTNASRAMTSARPTANSWRPRTPAVDEPTCNLNVCSTFLCKKDHQPVWRPGILWHSQITVLPSLGILAWRRK